MTYLLAMKLVLVNFSALVVYNSHPSGVLVYINFTTNLRNWMLNEALVSKRQTWSKEVNKALTRHVNQLWHEGMLKTELSQWMCSLGFLQKPSRNIFNISNRLLQYKLWKSQNRLANGLYTTHSWPHTSILANLAHSKVQSFGNIMSSNFPINGS